MDCQKSFHFESIYKKWFAAWRLNLRLVVLAPNIHDGLYWDLIWSVVVVVWWGAISWFNGPSLVRHHQHTTTVSHVPGLTVVNLSYGLSIYLTASSRLHRQRYQLFNNCDNLDQVGEVDMSFTSVLLQVCVTKSFCAPPTYLWRDSATKTENWNCTLNSIWKAYSVLKYRGLRLTMCCTKRLSTICQQLKHLLLL